MPEERPRRRQARGERRIAEILDAAAGVFAEAGFERATTNAIAAAAGISPGSLYQFFPNKAALAQALADRFVAEMAAAHRAAFDGTDFAALSVGEVADRVIDPILEFNLDNPGFKALFARPDMPSDLAAAAQPIQGALLGRVTAILAARVPGMPEPDRARSARVLIQIFQGMVPLVVSTPEPERPAVIAEVKRVLIGYLASIESLK
ncbi:TetR/AcrR family transcriptional regulator [Actinoplanes sp. NPDC051861]|uniref:TetR/AcrR family transcriptional regulator n=1 Tax=Actinoplanes sp. NPDC051861 TaxID=3155170 RepID=UPI003429BEF2